jgi:hypothetical protein
MRLALTGGTHLSGGAGALVRRLGQAGLFGPNWVSHFPGFLNALFLYGIQFKFK